MDLGPFYTRSQDYEILGSKNSIFNLVLDLDLRSRCTLVPSWSQEERLVLRNWMEYFVGLGARRIGAKMMVCRQ